MGFQVVGVAGISGTHIVEVAIGNKSQFTAVHVKENGIVAYGHLIELKMVFGPFQRGIRVNLEFITLPGLCFDVID